MDYVERGQGHNGLRRIFSRLEKLDVMPLGFVSFALLGDELRLC